MAKPLPRVNSLFGFPLRGGLFGSTFSGIFYLIMYSILAATNTAKAAIVLGQVFEASCGPDTYVGCKVLGMLHLEAWPNLCARRAIRSRVDVARLYLLYTAG
jgi:hypothetical protein